MLTASIERSRQKWLHEGLFERYWTKPSKKKPQVEANNPDKGTMHRLGVCSLIIEPHVFEVTLFQVKEAQYTFLSPTGTQMPPSAGAAYYHGGASMAPMYHSHTIQKSVQPKPPQTSIPQNQEKSQSNILPPFREGFAQFDPSGPNQPIPPPSPTSRPMLTNHPPPQTIPVPQSNLRKGESSKAGADGGTDPIIHMLAQRAATDPHLKALMKVVAAGAASESQLKAFQVHITELKAIRKRKVAEMELEKLRGEAIKEEPDQQYSQTYPQTPVAPYYSPTATSHQLYTPYIQPIPGTTTFTPPSIQTPQFPPHTQYPPQPWPIASKQISAPTALAFEFHAAPGDRFLFPRMSILEYLPGGTSILASFLLIRTLPPNSSSKTAKEYYQPVTARLSCHDPHVLKPLERVVAGKDEVRSWMESIMKRLPRAEDAYLATRLPRDKGNENLPLAIRQSKTAENPDVPNGRYSPVNSLMPLFSAAKAGATKA